MQTLLLSPRVVFLLLGDRDWIERAFSEHYKDLEGVAAGPEHSFGARFVEKAIQLSFVLPDVGDEKKDQYLKHLLAPKTKPAQPTLSDAAPLPQDLQQRAEAALAKPTFQAREHAMNSLRADIKSSTEITGQAETDALRNLNIQLTLKAATDKTAEEATGHMMLGLSKYLPDNPRQIKRIINTVTLLQELLRADDPEFQPGDEKWQLLVRWIVLMIEWPKSWYTLSKYPGLADMILGLNPLGAVPAERAEEYAGLLKKNGPVIQLLELKRVESNWRSRAIGSWQIAWLVRYAPPTSGSLIKLP
jgi:hypothetical protein